MSLFASRALLWLLMVSMAVVPVFFGGNIPPVWWGSLGLAGVLMLLLAFVPLAAVPRGVKLAAVGVMLVFVWAAVQLVPLSGSLNMLAHPMWHHAQAALGGDVLWNSISIHPQQSSRLLLLALAFPLFFYAGFQAAGGKQGVRLLKGFVAVVTGISLYGLVALLPETQYVLWKEQPQYIGNVTGTFLNRNSFATFAGMGVLCAVMLMQRHWLSIPIGKRAKKARYLAVLLVMVCALFLSSSRAGVACTVAGGLVYWAAVLYGEKRARKHMGKVLASLMAGLFMALLLVGSTVLERTKTVEKDFSLRETLYTNSWQAVKERPLLGHGLGSFEGVYKQYHTLDIPLWKRGRVDHAHNTALELMVELGIPATLVLMVAWFLLPIGFFGGILRRKKEKGHGNKTLFPALGLALWAQTTLHSLVDFSLEMQGVIVPLLILFGVCVRHCLPHASRVSTVSSPTETKRKCCAGFLMSGTLLIGVTLFCLPFSFQKPVYPLSQAPLQTYAWLRKGMNSRQAADYYMSFLTAPVEPKLFYPRLSYLAYEWPHFTDEEKRLFTPFLQRCIADEGERIWRRLRKMPNGTLMLIEGSLMDAL